MRISDWSSDVCSSDLPVDHCFLEMRRTGRRAMHDEAEARQVVALANLLRKLEQQREHRRNDEQMRHLLGFDRREKPLRIEPRVDHHASAAAQEEARPGIGRRMVERPRGRSEEHTSELQSRMRSTYDVFCLKKKKN